MVVHAFGALRARSCVQARHVESKRESEKAREQERMSERVRESESKQASERGSKRIRARGGERVTGDSTDRRDAVAEQGERTKREGSKIERERASERALALSLNRKQNFRPLVRLDTRRPRPFSPFPTSRRATPIHHKCNQIVLRAITIRSTPFQSPSLRGPQPRPPSFTVGSRDTSPKFIPLARVWRGEICESRLSRAGRGREPGGAD